MIGEDYLDPTIAAAVANLEEAGSVLSARVNTSQSTCRHAIVAETPYVRSGLGPRRICLQCRLEEEGSHWSGRRVWSYHDHSRPPELGNTEYRVVTEVDRDTFYRLRLPK